MSDERGEMTPQEMDELASVYLDGEATPEEAALVEGDPRLQELVEEFRAIRELVAAPVELPSDEVRDQMIAQALDHRAPVVSLEKARRRLRAVPPQARVVLAAAAVVAAIAVAGVTLFDRADRGDDDMMVADDAGPAPAMAEEPALDMAESAPVPESADAPAEEMMEEEMAMQLDEAPMDDGFDSDDAPEPAPMMADEAPMEAPSDDSSDAELEMADEQEVATTSGDALLVFETAADLADYALPLAEERIHARDTERLDETTDIDLMDCPLFPDEGLELLARFDAVVDEVETQVSVYLTEDHLQLTETTPPPQCELLNSHTFLYWSE